MSRFDAVFLKRFIFLFSCACWKTRQVQQQGSENPSKGSLGWIRCGLHFAEVIGIRSTNIIIFFLNLLKKLINN